MLEARVRVAVCAIVFAFLFAAIEVCVATERGLGRFGGGGSGRRWVVRHVERMDLSTLLRI